MKQVQFSAALMGSISLIYFLLDGRSRAGIRIATSCHGLLFVLAFLLSEVYRQDHQSHSRMHHRMVRGLWVGLNFLALASIVFSLMMYEGPKWIHFALVLMPPALFVLIFSGAFSVSGDG